MTSKKEIMLFCHFPGPGHPLIACAQFQQEATAPAQNAGLVAREDAVKFRFHCRFLRTCLRQNGKCQCQDHIIDGLTRHGPRPGELIIRLSMVTSSWLMARRSWLMAPGSRLMAHGQKRRARPASRHRYHVRDSARVLVQAPRVFVGVLGVGARSHVNLEPSLEP